MKCFIQLSKAGDVISILPILHHEWQTTGRKPILVIGKEYAQILEGCSYIEPLVWKGEHHDLAGAILFAKKRFSEVIVLQCHASNLPIHQSTPSFQLDQWKRAGCVEHFEEWPTVFDRLNDARSAKVIEDAIGPNQIKYIVFGDHSQSSPFPQKEELFELLKSNFPEFKILRLSEIRAKRIFDLLWLFNRAFYIVTVETAHVHLSKASPVPTIVLAADGWRGSAPHKKFALHVRYSEWDKRKGEVIETLKRIISGTLPARVEPKGAVSCVIPIYRPRAEMLKRCLEAVLPQVDEVIITREAGGVLPEFDIELDPKIKFAVHPESVIGFGRNVNFGAKQATGDYLLVLNDDVFLAPDAVEKMRAVMGPDVGLVGMMLRYPNGEIYHGGKRRLPGMVGFPHIDWRQRTPTIVVPTEMENVNGASFMFRRLVFEAIGGYNEEILFYTEDDWICMDVRKAGWRIIYTPFAIGVHDHHQESAGAPFKVRETMEQSNERFVKAWKPYFDHNAGNELGNFDYLK